MRIVIDAIEISQHYTSRREYGHANISHMRAYGTVMRTRGHWWLNVSEVLDCLEMSQFTAAAAATAASARVSVGQLTRASRASVDKSRSWPRRGNWSKVNICDKETNWLLAYICGEVMGTNNGGSPGSLIGCGLYS